jgi:5,10-methenyltetrahydrofolate synthetase
MEAESQSDIDDVAAWRKQQRALLLAQRETLPANLRDSVAPLILALIESHLGDLRGRCLGLYWPFRAEIDVRVIAERERHPHTEFALPAVITKGEPMAFHRWRPGDALVRGVWNIPVPASREAVHPDGLIVPLLGHDAAGYRLGYGGGYYDRTLAVMRPRPYLIGVGFSAGHLHTIKPQIHDIPMDAIVTEDGLSTFAAASNRAGAT